VNLKSKVPGFKPPGFESPRNYDRDEMSKCEERFGYAVLTYSPSHRTALWAAHFV
jgi:hypothetical protein